MDENKIQTFDNQPIRTAWDEENEEWYFSIVDVIAILTDQPDTRHAAKYWGVLKTRLKKEGSELTTNCSQLKLMAADGKRYNTDVATTEQLLRLIQSVPSKKAEPFKLWLAQVGRERIEETIDPEMSIDRAMETYAQLWYPEDWINQRLQAIRVRKELTDQWKSHGVCFFEAQTYPADRDSSIFPAVDHNTSPAPSGWRGGRLRCRNPGRRGAGTERK